MSDLVGILLSAEGPLSGEDIAGRLSVSRTAVWKQIKHLEEQGFVIETLRRKGYHLTAVPEKTIVPALVRHYYEALNGKPGFPFEHRHAEVCNSTNETAKEAASHGLASDMLFSADEQTAGRGRLDRRWESERGLDLTFSIALSADIPILEFYHFTMIAGLSVYQAANALTGETGDLRIKWPNDVYAGSSKLSGILSEMITEEGRVRSLVIGIGLNVNSEPALNRAVSIRQLTGKKSDRNRLLAAILERFSFYRALYQDGSFDAVYAAWKAHLGWLGESVRIDTGRGVLEGALVDVSAEGYVTIRRNGADERHYTGDLIV